MRVPKKGSNLAYHYRKQKSSLDSSKREPVQKFPILKKVKDIQAFIGLAGYYRKFIENFSKITKLLTKLTKKGEKFI